jgi:hypothetical protein
MSQHQRAPLPLELLEAVPQPVVVLLEVLLEKDPGQRFQTPAELLKAIPTITAAIDARRRITRQGLQKMLPAASHAVTRKRPAKPPPEKISIARLPVTGSDIFGREQDIAFLDRAWANKGVNVVTIVAWAGVGKSTLVNHWLRRMAAKHYRSAELVFGWSFYLQGTTGGTASADEFLDAALSWFGDNDPRIGTAWEKGERLAKLVAYRRTLLVLDGLEPLQNPPGPQEGRLREPSLQALLRELAAFNTGLCVITTRTPVADISDHERTSALRRDLEQLSSDAGAQLLRALGVQGDDAELRRAANEYHGHCLALTLLGSYLTDAFDGDIRRRKEVSEHLAHDVRHGAHARKVMESYQSWFGDGPELSVLRILGLFDRPVAEKALDVLLMQPAILGLTESLVDLGTTERRTVLARLRRARLLAPEEPLVPGQLDTHPLVREYFGEQLRSERAAAWHEANRRLYQHYRALAPPMPETFREMEPLFLAVICGCQAGLYRDTLREVYLPRIQRGEACFAANVLGARGTLLSVLVHFFEEGRWGAPAQRGVEGQRLTAEDQLVVLMQAALYLTATRGLGVPEAHNCYERVESLARSLDRPLPLYLALMGQWRYSLMNDRLSATMQIAQRVYSLAQEQSDPALLIGAYRTLAVTHYFSGNDFQTSLQYALQGIQLWRSGGAPAHAEEVYSPAVSCLYSAALSQWHLGNVDLCHESMAESIALAKELNDAHGLALALWHAVYLAHYERNSAEMERRAAELVELSTHHNLPFWRVLGDIPRGWTKTASGDTAEGLSWIEHGITYYRGTGSLVMSYLLGMKAEALHFAARTAEALEAISEAEAMAERSEERYWRAELHRLRGLFLAAVGAEETQTEASFCEAIRVAKHQKSISLQKRAEATYAEYRRQKASGSGGRGFRLPLW